MNSNDTFTTGMEAVNQILSTVKTGVQRSGGWWHSLSSMDPWFSMGLFLIGAILIVYRLNALERRGLEGTVLGTLVMPYASGFPNLMFAFSLGRQGGDGSVVLENCIVNNVTNLTLLIGLPALLWSLQIAPSASTQSRRKPTAQQRLNTLSLMLTLLAVFFFTGTLWVLGKDGTLDFNDGLVLVGTFVFWQVLHVFDVLKYNIHRNRTMSWTVAADTVLIVVLGVGVFIGIDRLVAWIMAIGPGFILYDQLGLISGCFMVLPNAMLAVYYSWAGRADIVYSSQIGDGHICIPMCIGLFALFSAIQVPDNMASGIVVILVAGLLHLYCVGVVGRLPREVGALLAAGYGFFLLKGLR